MCNSYHLSFSTLVIKVSHIVHFIKCPVTSVTRSPSPSPSPSRFLCLRTQQTAGRFVVTADVWWSPFFYFTSVAVFLCWHFRLIWFGRLIIAALWTVHHSVRTASQQTCSFLFPHKFPWSFFVVVCQDISNKYSLTSRKRFISSERMRGASSVHRLSHMLLIPADASRLF